MKVKKKSVEGLHTSLREIEGAGFIENKKEKNVNRRAGLRDKKAKSGEARIKRRKPLTLKHVRHGKRIAMTALSCVCVGAVGIVGAGFFMNKDNSTTDKIFNTVCYETPADGSLPTQHTLLENIGYLNYTLQNTEYWSSEMSSAVNAAGFKQNVQNYKQYYDGVLISVDIAEGFSQKANQFCVIEEAGVVLWRPSATKKFDGINTKWSEGSAEGCTIDEFREKRGFPPSEFSVYVLNENTVLNASEYSVTDKGDGTFEMTIELSVGVDDEHSADYYYRQQMMITGDLSSKPVITKTSVTYVFDASWRVLSFQIRDEYTALGGIPCSSVTDTKYDYSLEKAENSFYNDYFKKYENNFVKNDGVVNTEPKPLDYITAAFAPVLQGGAVLNLDLGFDGLQLGGSAYIELDDGALSDVRIALGDILVFIDGGNLYVSDGNAKYKLDVSGLFSAASAAEDDVADGSAAGLDTAALIDQLTGGEFTVTDKSACLKSVLSLFGLDISLTFDFDLSENGKIDLGGISAEIPFNGKTVSAHAKYGTENDIPAKPDDFTAYRDILNDGLSLDVSLSADGLKLDGFVGILMNQGAFEGVSAQLGELAVFFDCPRNMLYLTDGKSKYYLDLAQVSAGSTDISSVLNGLDTSGLLSQILNNLSAGDGKISTLATLEILEQTVTAALGIQLTGGLSIDASVDVLGHNFKAVASLSQKTAEKPETDGYKNILDGVAFDVKLSVDNLTFDGAVTVNLDGGNLVSVIAEFDSFNIYFVDNTLYIAIGDTKYKVTVPQSRGGLPFDLDGILKQVIDGLTFASDGVSANAAVSILEQTVKAALKVNLFGGLAVDAEASLAGKTVKLSAALSDNMQKLPELSGYTDILNDGITFELTLELDEVRLDGRVFIGFENGEFKTLKADFGDIKVYYYGEENNLYITVGTTNVLVPLGESEQGRVDLAGAFGGGLSSELFDLLGNLTTGLKSVSLNQEVKLLDSSLFVNVNIDIENGLKIGADTALLGIPVRVTVCPAANTLGEIDKDQYINIFENAFDVVNSVLNDNITVEVVGSLTGVENQNVEYGFAASLEYDSGVKENDSVYLHFNLALEAGEGNGDNLYLDVYLLDANPVNGENGFTAGGYTKDGELDVFVKVSKFTEGQNGYAPLQLYAPVREILTLVSVGAAIIDLDDLKFENSEALTNAVAKVSNLIDELLINKYLPATKDQFASLGESLIPQILGKSLGEFLNELLAPVISGAPAVPADGNSFDISAAYVKNVSYGDDCFRLILDSSLVYGAEGLDDTVAEVVSKDIEGVKFLSEMRLNNVYVGGNAQKLDLTAGFVYGEATRPSAENSFANYRNFDGVDTLIKALVNSATHTKANATEREIEISGLENLPDYILNHYYYIDGHLSVGLDLVGLVKPTIDLDIVALSVTIDEETNEVAVNIRLHYKELTAEAMGAKYIAINGESYVDLTIKNGMLYIKRTQVNRLIAEKSGWGGFLDSIVGTFGVELDATKGNTEACNLVTYRAYELNSISSDIADILDLVGYIFNLNEKLVIMINNNIAGSDTSNETNTKVDYSGYDYGELLSKYLDYFVYSDDGVGSASWKVSISGGFITDMLGMQTSSPVITFNADYVPDEHGAKVYTVQGLDIAPLTIKFLDSVNISMTVSGAFEYCNPQLEMKDGKVDVTHDAEKLWNEAIHLTLTSRIPFTFDGAVYEESCSFTCHYDYYLAAATADGYQFLGWWYSDDGVWKKLETAEGLEKGANVTVEALWVKIELSGSAKRSMGWGKYNYTVNSDFTVVEFVGNSEIISGLKLGDYTIRSFANNGASADDYDYSLSTKTGVLETGVGYSVNLDGTSGLLLKTYWNIRLDLSFTYENALGEVYSGVVTAHTYGKF